MTCADCRFRGGGRCHLNPPQAVSWPDTEWSSASNTWEIVYRFPCVEEDDWCGQFKPNEDLTPNENHPKLFPTERSGPES